MVGGKDIAAWDVPRADVPLSLIQAFSRSPYFQF